MKTLTNPPFDPKGEDFTNDPSYKEEQQLPIRIFHLPLFYGCGCYPTYVSMQCAYNFVTNENCTLPADNLKMSVRIKQIE